MNIKVNEIGAIEITMHSGDTQLMLDALRVFSARPTAVGAPGSARNANEWAAELARAAGEARSVCQARRVAKGGN